MAQTGFFVDEKCFWHSGGNYALTAPVGGLVQPLAAGGLTENPETKRRLYNLLKVTELADELAVQSAPPATKAELLSVHPQSYLDSFKAKSDAGGGELGLRTPFGPGGYEIASLSTGLVIGAVRAVLAGDVQNAYALCRPPGHHCLPEWSNGFCLLANIAVAIEAVQPLRVAVVDWDVHHGNGTEAIFYDRDDVLTISLHQENNYPLNTGGVAAVGEGAGKGFNMNIPLPPGAGHDSYLYAFSRLVLPRLQAFRPDLIVVACGFDASGVDPLSRMLCGAETFRMMTRALMQASADICGGRLIMAHEGGYSEVHVPFCGHAVLQEMSSSMIDAEDPLGARIAGQQPSAMMQQMVADLINSYAKGFDL